MGTRYDDYYIRKRAEGTYYKELIRDSSDMYPPSTPAKPAKTPLDSSKRRVLALS